MTEPLHAARAPEINAGEKPSPRWDIGRDAVGGVLLLLALLAPWNLQFGVGIAGSNGKVLVALIVVTVLSWASIVVTYAGRSRFDARVTSRLRLWLNVGYLFFIAAIVLWDLLVTVLFGAAGAVPPGVGPGAWMGITGALLCAQPVLGSPDRPASDWFRVARVIGAIAVAFGAQYFGLNMYWRIRAVGSADAAGASVAQHVGFLSGAAAYGALSLAIVVIAAWWMSNNTEPARLASVGLGAATLLTALTVWVSDLGLGIVPAQGAVSNASLSIGFQGYLLWCAAAAIFAPKTLRETFARNPIDGSVLRAAMRHGLLLIAVWCGGMIVVRLAYLGLAEAGDVDLSQTTTWTMIAANLVTAGIALWQRVLLASRTASVVLVSSASGLLFLATAVRIAVDIGQSAQHITATFNIVTCFLAVVLAAFLLLSLTGRRSTAITRGAVDDSRPRIFVHQPD